jgi:hypothetical protein
MSSIEFGSSIAFASDSSRLDSTTVGLGKVTSLGPIVDGKLSSLDQ